MFCVWLCWVILCVIHYNEYIIVFYFLLKKTYKNHFSSLTFYSPLIQWWYHDLIHLLSAIFTILWNTAFISHDSVVCISNVIVLYCIVCVFDFLHYVFTYLIYWGYRLEYFWNPTLKFFLLWINTSWLNVLNSLFHENNKSSILNQMASKKKKKIKIKNIHGETIK